MDKVFADKDTLRRLIEIRKYRNLTQGEVAGWVGISQPAYGKREKGTNDGFSAGEFTIILNNTQIDARWLFGQMGDVPIQKADLTISDNTSPQAVDVAELLSEYRALKENYKTRDKIAERVQQDNELRDCVKMLIENRGNIKRVMGYLDRISEERERGGARDAQSA